MRGFGLWGFRVFVIISIKLKLLCLVENLFLAKKELSSVSTTNPSVLEEASNGGGLWLAWTTPSSVSLTLSQSSSTFSIWAKTPRSGLSESHGSRRPLLSRLTSLALPQALISRLASWRSTSTGVSMPSPEWNGAGFPSVRFKSLVRLHVGSFSRVLISKATRLLWLTTPRTGSLIQASRHLILCVNIPSGIHAKLSPSLRTFSGRLTRTTTITSPMSFPARVLTSVSEWWAQTTSLAPTPLKNLARLESPGIARCVNKSQVGTDLNLKNFAPIFKFFSATSFVINYYTNEVANVAVS